MMVISVNVTDICNSVLVTKLNTVQMLNHLILTPTLGGKCCYSHFPNEENDEPKVNNVLGVTQLVVGKVGTQIQAACF